ncbi:MAG: TPM domain-containing protein [Candidatus Pacearchaeota archaeon]
MDRDKPVLVFLFVTIILFSSSFVFAQEISIPSYKDNYVNDFAGIFNFSQVDELRSLLIGVEQTTTAEVVVVSINDCGGDYDDYAIRLASSWKIGKEDKDNGLLILYCLTQNKLVVKTGYGLEGILPDSKIGRLLDERYVPLRDAGKTAEGIIYFTEEIVYTLNSNKEEIISGNTRGNFKLSEDYKWVLLVILIFLIIYFILKTIFKKNTGRVHRRRGIWSPHRIGHAGGRGFGGGRFGGGGASR